MSTVSIGNITVHYQKSGSGPPVVLLHGLAEDHRSWSEVQAQLSDYTTYAVDLRGHGSTTSGDGEGSLKQLGHDLIGFLEQVTGPAAVVGFSLGGTIVLWAAAERPDLVSHPIAVATSSIVGRAAVKYFTGRIAQVESGDMDGFAVGMRADTAQQVVSEMNIDALVAHRLEAVGNGEGYINAANAMIGLRTTALTPRLRHIKQHVEVIGGECDLFCPRKAADIMLEALPNATYHEIAGASHLIAVDQPAAFIELLAKLLKKEVESN